jgi:hypothetical protein
MFKIHCIKERETAQILVEDGKCTKDNQAISMKEA